MKTSKTTAAGIIICLVCQYLMHDIFANDGVLEILNIVGFFGFPVGVIVAIRGLFKKPKDEE